MRYFLHSLSADVRVTRPHWRKVTHERRKFAFDASRKVGHPRTDAIKRFAITRESSVTRFSPLWLVLTNFGQIFDGLFLFGKMYFDKFVTLLS